MLHSTNYNEGHKGSYVQLPNEQEFEFETDQVTYTVIGYDFCLECETLQHAIVTVKEVSKELGIILRVRVDKLFYIKRWYAMNQSGEFIFQYYSVWREVPIIAK